jgi:RecJ-like exonuclease
MGLNLGLILEEAAREVGGRGGGHAMAAGAIIPSERWEQFLSIVDKIIGLQKGGKNLG